AGLTFRWSLPLAPPTNEPRPLLARRLEPELACPLPCLPRQVRPPPRLVVAGQGQMEPGLARRQLRPPPVAGSRPVVGPPRLDGRGRQQDAFGVCALGERLEWRQGPDLPRGGDEEHAPLAADHLLDAVLEVGRHTPLVADASL